MDQEFLATLFNADGSMNLTAWGALLEQPGCVLFCAVVLELLIPIPECCRVRALTPLFQQLSSKVNLPSNTMPQQYFAGIMLPLLLVMVGCVIVLLLNLVSGYDTLLSLLLLPFLLESRPQSRICVRVSRLLRAGNKAEARRILQSSMIRECGELSSMGISKACSEYALMSTAAGYLAVMVWFEIAGLKGALIMQMVAVMSRCFSQKLARNAVFGACTGKVFQGLMAFPALIMALSCVISLSPIRSLRKAAEGFKIYPSFVSGLILGAAGGADNISLGGPRRYEGRYDSLPRIGGELQPDERSPITLLRRAILSSLIFCVAVLVFTFMKL